MKYLALPYPLLSTQLLETAKSEFCNRAEITEIETFQRESDLRSLPAITTKYTSPGIDNIERVGDVFPVLIVLQGFSHLD